MKSQAGATGREGKLESRKVPCERCPLRGMKVFRKFTADELKFVSTFKIGEITLEPGQVLLPEGESTPYLFTVLSGWLFRHKALPDGRRQILNFALPGDFIGMQATVFTEMQHTVETLTDARLCVFPREKIWTLYSAEPGLGFDITWLVAREEKMLDDQLLSVGRRSALERMAFLMMLFYRRAVELQLLEDGGFELPISQQHVADTLGLSLVHTNKTLRKLYDRGVISWRSRTLVVLDEHELARIARYESIGTQLRPLI